MGILMKGIARALKLHSGRIYACTTFITSLNTAPVHCKLSINICWRKEDSEVIVTHSCPTLFNPMDCSPPGSSVHGILQVRILMSIDRWMDKEVVIYIHNGILLSIKRNTFESVLMRWMNLEPIIQSEVSQKEKDKYSILTHIYGI